MWFSALDLPSEKDLHKILQVLEPHVSFLEDLTKMGGAMRSVLTQVLTSQQFYKDLSSGMFGFFLIIKFSNYEQLKGISFLYHFSFCMFLFDFSNRRKMHVFKDIFLLLIVGGWASGATRICY